MSLPRFASMAEQTSLPVAGFIQSCSPYMKVTGTCTFIQPSHNTSAAMHRERNHTCTLVKPVTQGHAQLKHAHTRPAAQKRAEPYLELLQPLFERVSGPSVGGQQPPEGKFAASALSHDVVEVLFKSSYFLL